MPGLESAACVRLMGIASARFVSMNARLSELKEDIARRLRSVMLDLPDAEFKALVQQMAEIQYKHEQRRRTDLFQPEEPAR